MRVAAYLVALVAMMASASPLAEPDPTADAYEVLSQDAIAQLTNTLKEFARSDQEMKQHLIETMDAILTEQASVEGLEGVSTTDPDGARVQQGLALFTRVIVNTVREINNSSNNIQLAQIIDELKGMNTVFKDYIARLSCPPPFVLMGNECFAIVLEDLTWEGARQRCLNMDADLAQPEDITELRLYVTRRYPRKDRRNFWLGGVNKEKVWQWLSGELVDPTFWHVNEPSGNGDCLAMFDGWDYPLTDFPCENERRAVCERVMHF